MYLHVCVIGGACVRMCVRMWRVSQGQRQHITGVWPCETSCRQGQRGAHDTSAPPARRQVRACCCSLREATQRTHAHKPIPTSLRRPRRHGPSVRPIPAFTSHPSLGSQRAGRHSAAVTRVMQRVPPAPHTLSSHSPVFTPPRTTPMAGRCATTSCVATPCVVTRLRGHALRGHAPGRSSDSTLAHEMQPASTCRPCATLPRANTGYAAHRRATQGTQPTACSRAGGGQAPRPSPYGRALRLYDLTGSMRCPPLLPSSHPKWLARR